jgi:hypothetical protein
VNRHKMDNHVHSKYSFRRMELQDPEVMFSTSSWRLKARCIVSCAIACFPQYKRCLVKDKMALCNIISGFVVIIQNIFIFILLSWWVITPQCDNVILSLIYLNTLLWYATLIYLQGNFVNNNHFFILYTTSLYELLSL